MVYLTKSSSVEVRSLVSWYLVDEGRSFICSARPSQAVKDISVQITYNEAKLQTLPTPE